MKNHVSETETALRAVFAALGATMPDHVRYTLQQAHGLWTLAPFVAGDRVVLRTPREITREGAPGWWGYRHLHVEGALATVTEMQWWEPHGAGKAEWVALVTFDADTDRRPAHFALAAWRLERMP